MTAFIVKAIELFYPNMKQHVKFSKSITGIYTSYCAYPLSIIPELIKRTIKIFEKETLFASVYHH